MGWPKYKLGEVLSESKIESENPDTNKRIRVRLNAKGVEKRPNTEEKKGATKQYIRKSGQFIYGKQNLHKGAFGVIPPELDGYESSSDIPSFDVDTRCLPEWIDYYFKAGNFYLSLASFARGIATKRISPKDFYTIEIPLPDLTTQMRIIKGFKISGKLHNELTCEIIYQQTLLTKLKQSILQDAISGKLTEQWRKENPDVEPASELLKRIKAKKERLVKEKKIKKEKPLPPITKDEVPFKLPEGWVWCRLGEIGNAISFPFIDGPFGSSINTRADYIEDGIPVLRMMNVKPFNFINSPIKFISFNKFESLKKHNVLPGDILFSKVGAGIGEACIVPNGFGPGLLSTTGITRIRVGQIVDNNYLCHFLNGNINEFKSIARQTSQPFLNMTMIKTFLFPLPPYLDQLEIIRKTTELIKICNHIENQNLNNFKNIQMLMQMVLKEAFEEK